MLFAFALNIIETILNRYLLLDPETKPRLATCAGKVVALNFHYLDCQLYFLLTHDKIHLTDHYLGPVDVTLRGTPLDFLRLSVNSNTANLFASGISFEGDNEVAQQFKALFAHLDIDWEEQLSQFTGDIVAHQIGNLFRSLTAWAKQSSDSLQQNLSEYLHEEIRVVPPPEELQYFFTEVEQVRDAVERLEQRIHRLQHQLINTKDHPA